MNRGTSASDSSRSGGTNHATMSAISSSPYRTSGRGNVTRRATSTANSTASRIPANTSEFTNQVVPNSSANCTTLFVSSNRNAAPMKNRSA